MMRVRQTAAVMIAILLTCVTACSGQTASPTSQNQESGPPASMDPAAAPGGDLTYAVVSFPTSNDIYANFDAIAVATWPAWWEYLFRPTADGTGFEPRLATGFEVSPDNKTYTIKLREGVTFSNGDPFSSDDVLYSLNKAFTVESSNLTFLDSKIASMTAPDKYTVKVVFKESWPYFISDLSGFMAAIIDKKLVESMGYEEYIKNPVGTGPFTIDKIDPGSSITLKRNPTYWEQGLPKLNTITLVALGDDSARATAVQSGRADIAAEPPPNQLESLKSNSEITVIQAAAARVDNIAVNTKIPALANDDLRRAISLGIDRDAIVKAGLFGTAQPANTFIVGPPALKYQVTDENFYPYDPEQAKALVAKSGLPTPISLDLLISDGSEQSAIGEVIKQNLAAIGIEINITRADINTTEAAIGNQDFTLATTFWTDYQPEPTIQPLFAIDPDYCCDAYLSGYSNAEHIAVLKEAIAATDEAKRVSLFAEVQKNMAQDANVIPLYFKDQVFLTTKKVAGFFPYPNNLFAYEQWQLQ